MRRRGQVSAEYLLLLCAVLTLTVLTGSFLARYGTELADRMAEKLLEAAVELSRL